MSEETLAKANSVTKDAELITQNLLSDPDAKKLDINSASAEEKAIIESHMSELDMSDAQSIIRFGSGSQSELQIISQQMLSGVRNIDVGPAGSSLREMVSSIRGFSVDELDPNRKQSWWEKIIGKAKPMAQFMAKYEDVQEQIDSITNDLLSHETILLKDIKSLDRLYEKTLSFYRELALYIAAGEEKIRVLDDNDIPAKSASVEDADENNGVIIAQELRDLRAARDDLDRRIHDLKLTRQVTMQSLPSIRLVQENDKTLVTKINSALVNTIPLWETQLAQAVTIHRSKEAAEVVKDANDLTNELLQANAENLKEANRIVRSELERGAFDIEAVKKANADLIETIEESLRIAEEGKEKRNEAEHELVIMESELKNTLAAAKAKETGTGVNLGESVKQ